MPADDLKERTKALDIAVSQIEKQFGKGSIMRLGQNNIVAPVEVISTEGLEQIEANADTLLEQVAPVPGERVVAE